MIKAIQFLVLILLSSQAFSQQKSNKDLVLKIKAEKTSVIISPDRVSIYTGESFQVKIKIFPAGRKIGKVTFKGGVINGKDSLYTVTAGGGAEGILSVYEKASDGTNRLIANKVYAIKRSTLKAFCAGAKNDSVIDLLTLLALGKLTARIEESKKPVPVIGFEMRNSSTNKADTLYAKGNVLTKEMKQNVARLKAGSAVYFYNIRCQMPDTMIRTIPSLRIFIDEAKPMQIGM
jgi:hypothetical protein